MKSNEDYNEIDMIAKLVLIKMYTIKEICFIESIKRI